MNADRCLEKQASSLNLSAILVRCVDLLHAMASLFRIQSVARLQSDEKEECPAISDKLEELRTAAEKVGFLRVLEANFQERYLKAVLTHTRSVDADYGLIVDRLRCSVESFETLHAFEEKWTP